MWCPLAGLGHPRVRDAVAEHPSCSSTTAVDRASGEKAPRC